jgi:hypothetical protein
LSTGRIYLTRCAILPSFAPSWASCFMNWHFYLFGGFGRFLFLAVRIPRTGNGLCSSLFIMLSIWVNRPIIAIGFRIYRIYHFFFLTTFSLCVGCVISVCIVCIYANRF